MSNDLKQKAKEYLKLQLSVIPTKEDKRPTIAWTPYQSQRIEEKEVESVFTGASIRGLGIVCGAVSGNLEVIDVDCKYDSTGSLWEELSSVIDSNLPDLYKSLVIAQTKNKGYHIYYRCSSIQRSFKLANRYTTLEEKEQTYQKEIEKKEPEHIARARAENDKARVLIETRAEGGYIIAPPTLGYKYIQGEPSTIPTISEEDRASLFRIARSFNEVEEQAPREIVSIKKSLYDFSGLSPWKDYDERGDVIELLQSKGWKLVSQRGERIHLLRPGSTDSATSGNFHTGLRVLKIFSSSTEFSPDRGYSPSQVFTILECNGDSSLSGRKLRAQGYGESYKNENQRGPTLVKTERIKVETVNSVNRESHVISMPGESLKIENIQTAIGKEIVITTPGPEAQEETLKAIELSLQTGKRIYVIEGENEEVNEYIYRLWALIRKYGAIQEPKQGLTDREIDNFLEETVALASSLEPLDKDLFLKYFLSQKDIKELGISEEALAEATDRLTISRDKEAQKREFNSLIKKATELESKGEIKKAIKLIEEQLKTVKQKDKAAEFNKLLLPTTEALIYQEESSYPESLISGISLGEEPLLLPAGALTVYAAPTNHGKTMLLINTALNVADRYPDKKFIFFTYEERSNAIIQYFLNTYMDINLNTSNKTNRRVIKEHYRTGSTEFISTEKLQYFINKKEEFYNTYIKTGRILVKYIELDSDELTTAIEYLHQKDGSIGGVFIDYIQLLSLPEGKESHTRQSELAKICSDLKESSVNTGLPFILAAQFNREAIALTRLHPTKIREAGDIEHSANTIVGFWNMQKETVEHALKDEEKKEISNKKVKAGVEKFIYEGSFNEFIYAELLKSREQATGSYSFLELNGNTGKVKNREDIISDFEEEYIGDLKKITRKKNTNRR